MPACVNKQPQGIVLWLSGHTACSQQSHSARGSQGGCRGRQHKDHCSSPKKKAPFVNIENTRLAPWSGMHAWFRYTLQMVGRLCVSLYIYVYMYVCMFIFTYVAPEESSLSTQTLVRMLLLSSITAMVPGRSFDLLFPLSWRCSVCTDCRSLGSPVSTTWPKNSSLIKLWFQI